MAPFGAWPRRDAPAGGEVVLVDLSPLMLLIEFVRWLRRAGTTGGGGAHERSLDEYRWGDEDRTFDYWPWD